MPKSFTQSKLQDLLQEVPEDIKEWIGSEKITNTIIKLNEKLGLKDEKRRVIPRMLLRLETKDLHPAEFIEEIAHNLDIGMKSANMISEEIKKEILEPIEPSLNQWGVNIDLIEPEFSKPSADKEIKTKEKKEPVSDTEEKEEEEKERKQIPISSSPKSQLKTPVQDTEQKSEKDSGKNKPQEDIKPKTTPKETSKESSENKPFMIHQEGGFNKKESEVNQSKGKRKRKKSFSFSKDGFFDSNKNKKGKSSPKAEIGTPGKSKEEKKEGGIFGFGGKKKEKERVVHYSDNRTDLSDDGSNKFINLSNLEPTSPKNKNRKQKKSDINKQQKENKKTGNKQTKNNSSSKDSSFLGNIDKGSVAKKDYKKDDKNNKQQKRNKGDGPHVDGNTVDLSQN